MGVVDNLSLPSRRYSLGVITASEALRYFKFWILAAVLISFLWPLAYAQYSDFQLSAWFYTANIGKWFTAFVGSGFVFVLVPILIAGGMTRREVSTAMGVLGALWSAALGVLVIAGLLAERAYYGAMGWTPGIDANDPIPPIGSWGDPATLAVYPLVYLAYFAAGAVIGAAAYRWEGTGWLLLFPVLPVVLSLDNAVFDTEPFGPSWAGVFGPLIDDWGRGIVIAGTALLVTALAIAAHRILIDIPLRAKKA